MAFFLSAVLLLGIEIKETPPLRPGKNPEDEIPAFPFPSPIEPIPLLLVICDDCLDFVAAPPPIEPGIFPLAEHSLTRRLTWENRPNLLLGTIQ